MKIFLFALSVVLILTGCTNSTPSSASVDTSRADVDANTDEWRVITVDAVRRTFTPSSITVKQGEKVKLVINNIDTTHDAVFDTMQVTTDADGAIILDTSVVGTYPFRCATFCGEGHKDMGGTVIVE